MFKSIKLGLAEIFSDPKRRQVFFERTTQDEVATQIRDWRKRRNLTQSAFAKLVEMKQSAVSRLESADYAAWNFATLMRIASALDGRWKVVFIPSDEAIKEFEDIESDAAASPSPTRVHGSAVQSSTANVIRVPQSNTGASTHMYGDANAHLWGGISDGFTSVSCQ